MSLRRSGSLALVAAFVAAACSAAQGSLGDDDTSGAGGSGGSDAAGGEAGKTAHGGGDPSGDDGGSTGSGGGVQIGDDGGAGGPPVMTNACNSQCGPTELCDDDHLGIDDDCDGQVDEICSCKPGQTHACFAGDPSYRGMGACKDGTERCTEVGVFSGCQGGKQATAPDNCQMPTTGTGCTDITASPFAQVNLAAGTGAFASDADPGSSSYAITCPTGVTSCPQPTSSGFFTALQSGQYGVTYTKTVNGTPETCNFSVYVGGGGLRVELSWDNDGVEAGSGDLKGPDLDLHVHKPNSTTPWQLGDQGTPDDCFYGNCKAGNYEPGASVPGPEWFSDSGTPHNWSFSSVAKNNSCYFAPRGLGGAWQDLGLGCHNPRLDIDNFGCDASVKDPSSADFCAPENVNLDEVPDGAFFRVGVFYDGVCTKTLPTHPTLRVYCAGGEVAELGEQGYDAPVTFTPDADCGKTFWVAADIYVHQGTCAVSCTVLPIYADGGQKPLFLTRDDTKTTFGPAYPAAPSP